MTSTAANFSNRHVLLENALVEQSESEKKLTPQHYCFCVITTIMHFIVLIVTIIITHVVTAGSGGGVDPSADLRQVQQDPCRHL